MHLKFCLPSYVLLIDYFRMVLSRNVTRAESDPGSKNFLISLYLALVYIKLLSELGLTIPKLILILNYKIKFVPPGSLSALSDSPR